MKKQFTVSPVGIALIKKYEGCRLTAYRDAVGIPTIGYGHIKDVKMGDVITQAQADDLLEKDVAHFARGVNTVIQDLNVQLKQHQFDALVVFCFNVGLGAFKKSTMLKKLYLMSQSDQASIYAVADEFTRWNKAGGKVLTGLVRRRGEERLLFLGVNH